MNKHFGAHSNKSIRNATNEEEEEAVENIFGGQASTTNVTRSCVFQFFSQGTTSTPYMRTL